MSQSGFHKHRFGILLFLAACVLSIGVPDLTEARAFQLAGERGTRSKPSDIPEEWKRLVGEYRLGADTILVMEQEGALHLLETSGRTRRLVPMGKDSLMAGDILCTFRRSAERRGTSLTIGASIYHRVLFGNEGGNSFRIKPLGTVETLRKVALEAPPPREQGEFKSFDLVELTRLDTTIHLDIRYATRNNFVGEQFYSQPRAFLQRPAAIALVRAHRALLKRGYGMLIHDAYRPWYVTRMFWDATPAEQKNFVADPSKGSRHNRGCAVDLSLYDASTGLPVEMVSGYDEFSHRAYPGYPGGTSLQRWYRRILREAMENEGFSVFIWEWWHYDYQEWRDYTIGTITFEMIR